MSSPTPVPKWTMFILCAVILSEPISLTILFPFVFFLVESFGIPKENIGYYVGFIASSFSFAQFVTSFFWGWLSDRIGRRPILLFGLLGNAISTVMFGFSHSLAWAIATRTACGFLNGNIGVAKSVLGEITDSTNRGAAFSLLGLNFGIGLIVGPSLGGLLSYPTKSFPDLFGGIKLFEDNPFLLPCLCSSTISLLGFVVGYFLLPETLKSKTVTLNEDECEPRLSVDSNDTIRDEEEIDVENCEADGNEEGLRSTKRQNDDDVVRNVHNTSNSALELIGCEFHGDFTSEEVVPLLPSRQINQGFPSNAIQSAVAYAILAFGSIIFAEIFPLWCVAPRPIGLSLNSVQIGVLLSSLGVFTIICQLLIYPTMSRRFSTLTLYRYPMPIYLAMFLTIPLLPALFTGNMLWPVLMAILGVKAIAENFLFTSVMVLITNSAPPGKLGQLNGIAQAGAAGVRAIGPAFGGIIWAWSLNNGLGFPFNHFFIFGLISLTILLMIYQAFYQLK